MSFTVAQRLQGVNRFLGVSRGLTGQAVTSILDWKMAEALVASGDRSYQW